MRIDLVPAQLLLSVPAGISALACVAMTCALLRIRDPRVRGALALLGIADVVCAALGLPCVAFFVYELQVTESAIARHLTPYAATALAVWLGVAGGSAARRILRARRINRTLSALAGLSTMPEDVTDEVRIAARLAGVRAPETLLVPNGGTAFIAGLRRPRLVISAGLWTRLDARARRALLLHELVHVRRHDNILQMAAGLLADVLWFNWPLRCLIANWLREREAAADLAAVRRGASAAGLARSLLAALEEGAPRVRAAVGLGGGCAGVATRARLAARPPRRTAVLCQVALLLLLFPWQLFGAPSSRVHVTNSMASGNGRVSVGLFCGASPLLRPILHHYARRIETP